MSMRTSAVKKYINAYVRNELRDNLPFLGKSFSISYSTVGEHDSKQKAVSALQTPGDFGCRYNIISNVIEYKLDDKEVVILNAFHFFVTVIKNEYLPLILGGKYKFILRDSVIERVFFDLETEMGNTYYAKKVWGYHLMAESADDYRVLLDDVPCQLVEDEMQIGDSIRKMMLIADRKQKELASKYATPDAVCWLAGSTYAEQFGSKDGGRTIVSLQEFIETNKMMEAQNHHSMRICDITISGNQATARLEMLEPTRLGFKHFDALSVYQPYYNEEWTVDLKKENGWKITKMQYSPISKFQRITYDTLEV